MLGFGWKKKAEILRVTIVSAGHRIAKPLSPKFERVIELFAQLGKTGDIMAIHGELTSAQDAITDADRPLWEPAEIYGWLFQATLYIKDGKLWWLVHATRKINATPSDKDIAFLKKALEHLGAQPDRHALIGPNVFPPGEEDTAPLLFGWWTWQNHHDLMDIQVNKNKKGKEMLRFVPAGSRGSDGYETVDTSKRADLGELDKEPDAGA